MKTAFRKYVPAAVVISICLIATVLFAFTDLRFYAMRKNEVIQHAVSVTKAEVKEVKSEFSFEFNIESLNNFYNNKKIATIEDRPIYLYSIQVRPFNLKAADWSSTKQQIEIIFMIPVTKTDKGINVLSTFPFPELDSPFYKEFNLGWGEKCEFSPQTDNVMIYVGEKEFKGIYSSGGVGSNSNPYDKGLYNYISYTVFQNPDDFTNIVAIPQVRTIKVVVSKLYENDYELNPIMRGALS